MRTNPKTIAVKIIQGNYGFGWDDLGEYGLDEHKRLRDDYRAYCQNETRNSHRIITRRVPNPNYIPK